MQITDLDQSFQDRVALLTGASGGIGQAIGLALAREGATLALAYGSSKDAANALADRIRQEGGRAVAIGADLSGENGPRQLVEQVEQELGPIDVLVSNAGRGEIRSLEELTVEEFDLTFAINLRAPFLLAQAVLPGMSGRGFGRIVLMASAAAFTGGIVGAHYAASKAGLNGLTHYLASGFASSGVTVNAVAPALIAETGMLPGTPEQLAAQIPVRRLGRPEEVADLTVSILRNPFVTNQVMSIDGGIYPR